MMSKQKPHRLAAVHEGDVKNLLRSLHLLDDVVSGSINCRFCSAKITLENLQCLYPVNNEIVFCCDKIECYQRALQESGKG